MLVVAGCVGGGCGGAQQEQREPSPSLSTSHAAQSAFRDLYADWTQRHQRDLEPLMRRARDFLERYPNDGRAPLVRVYLAWLYVERGQLARAEHLLTQLERDAVGATKDLATIAQAAILRRRGQAEKAYVSLRALRGKIVDPHEHQLFSEQLVRATLAVQREDEVFEYLLDWLEVGARLDLEGSLGDVERILSTIDDRTLEKYAKRVGPITAEADASDRQRAQVWLLSAVREKLTRAALKARDAELAKRLVESGGASEVSKEELVELARRGELPAKIEGRALGLVVSLRTEQTRRRSAQVVTGVSRALGLPRSSADASGIQLMVQHEDGEDNPVSEVLQRLAAEGASILVAGVDAASAGAALEFAERRRIPVLVLVTPPEPPKSADYGFQLGADSKAALAAFGVTPPATDVVGPECPAAGVGMESARFPLQRWAQKPPDWILLLGDAPCSLDAARQLQRIGLKPTLALGLEASELYYSLPGRRVLAIAAGEFPVEPEAAGGASSPSWFESLGHDAALLAAAALRSESVLRSDVPEQVRARHEVLRNKLQKLTVHDLWTTAAQGFDENRLTRVFSRKERRR